MVNGYRYNCRIGSYSRKWVFHKWLTICQIRYNPEKTNMNKIWITKLVARVYAVILVFKQWVVFVVRTKQSFCCGVLLTTWEIDLYTRLMKLISSFSYLKLKKDRRTQAGIQTHKFWVVNRIFHALEMLVLTSDRAIGDLKEKYVVVTSSG